MPKVLKNTRLPENQNKCLLILTDNQCLSFPCHNGATCNNTGSGFNCQCEPGWDMTTNCSTGKYD